MLPDVEQQDKCLHVMPCTKWEHYVQTKMFWIYLLSEGMNSEAGNKRKTEIVPVNDPFIQFGVTINTISMEGRRAA